MSYSGEDKPYTYVESNLPEYRVDESMNRRGFKTPITTDEVLDFEQRIFEAFSKIYMNKELTRLPTIIRYINQDSRMESVPEKELVGRLEAMVNNRQLTREKSMFGYLYGVTSHSQARLGRVNY
jgi:hypothetical protein